MKHEPGEKRAEGNQEDIDDGAYGQRRFLRADPVRIVPRIPGSRQPYVFPAQYISPRGREKTACGGQEQDQSGKGERNDNGGKGMGRYAI